MNKLKNKKLPLRREFSAGGVVYRTSEDGKREYLLGNHSGYHKWVLPKGKIEPGERSWQTAIREVREEEGVETILTLEKPIHIEKYFFFDKVKIFKTVSFYLLQYRSGDCQKDHDLEMEEVGWLLFEDALERLAFKGEREALKKAEEILKTTSKGFLIVK